MNTTDETLDLMRDEFARIAADDSTSDHIRFLCQRAMMDITCRIPLIAQRDRAERELVLARVAIIKAMEALECVRDIDGCLMTESAAYFRLARALPYRDQPPGFPEHNVQSDDAPDSGPNSTTTL